MTEFERSWWRSVCRSQRQADSVSWSVACMVWFATLCVICAAAAAAVQLW